ncbi:MULTISPECIES: ATP-grasp domain-containing protein [Aneurinibacillus]|jgi:D-alanine-D-alanine ligase-like ATP-grasp enzyme|uniref:ATP-grasp domain-containing protein n=1 Tax=Aneurinibacillus thermoaerophilus TaxID=143495 RepID=A0A1G8BKM6_ANETH|nr:MULTISPECIES: ATP-grasp domain-containing protein [Aneurinibacillus]AMA73376.1 hypothetical protein ACH33_11275 [Aneurinibacillus sp. XH2]MED0676037.1 ATP-grasp domain-containing protein [Aneurinibacillus thermoaerophilus]MED0736320.1 ATP-grasp domain-containing protein [Aneurinibacillus thermoaerophilus]MED0757386.1 ATP-grasp domain-containing protein [Aneurinibacillus thermoaerophilus]MED0759569.1 ATP-grasp domain-containing protein [Aneurinibacillus thermoaerophilus]
MNTLVIVAPPVYQKYVNAAALLCPEIIWIGPDVIELDNKRENVICFEANARVYEELHQVFRQVIEQYPVEQIETPYEFYIENVAYLREVFQIPGSTVAQIVPTRYKDVMKDCFVQHDVPCAKHKKISNLVDLTEFVQLHGYPMIFKPLNNAGSRNVFRITSEEEAVEKAKYFLDVLEEPFLAEEFIDIQQEGSYDVVIVGGKVVFGTISVYEPLVLETAARPGGQRIYIRHDLPKELDQAIRIYGQKAIEALNITHSFAHIEYMIDRKGRLLIGEVGARIPGAQIPLLMGLSQGISMEQVWAEHLIYRSCQHELNRTWHTGILFINAETDQPIQKLENLDLILQLYGEAIVYQQLPSIGQLPKLHRLNMDDTDAFIIVKDRSSKRVKEILDDISQLLKIT